MILIEYSKLNGGQFIPHLDMLKHLTKIIRRTGISVKYSQGFNPHILIYMSSPIALGLKSLSEYCLLDTDALADGFVEKFNACAPKGIRCVRAFNTDKKVKLALGVVVMSRKAVLSLCEETISRGLQDMVRDYLKKNIDNLKIMGYEYKGYAKFITSQKSFYDANMELLSDENREKLFIEKRPIFTKVRDDFPASYGIDSRVKNSIVADGCIIEGTVENSILFRGAVVKKGAVVKNCILMQGSVVSENCKIECAITDKNVLVSEYKAVSGTLDYPIYFAKNKKV
jgi:radical SAM-linked protein